MSVDLTRDVDRSGHRARADSRRGDGVYCLCVSDRAVLTDDDVLIGVQPFILIAEGCIRGVLSETRRLVIVIEDVHRDDRAGQIDTGHHLDLTAVALLHGADRIADETAVSVQRGGELGAVGARDALDDMIDVDRLAERCGVRHDGSHTVLLALFFILGDLVGGDVVRQREDRGHDEADEEEREGRDEDRLGGHFLLHHFFASFAFFT